MAGFSPLSAEQLRAFCDELGPQLDGDLRTDAMTRALYATDASMYEIEPEAVLIPQHARDVQIALEVADDYNVPVLPRGGGSSLAGQTVGAALVIDFTKHLDAILEINAEEQWARVQPGVVLDVLNEAAAEHGLMVGPDPAPSSRATLGGMLANNSTGTHSVQYGNFIHHVRSVEALLADGSAATFEPLDHDGWQARMRQSGLEGDIYRGLDALLAEQGDVVERDTPAHWRRNSGYRIEHLLNGDTRNLAELVCGSEGTLAVATELTLDLVPRPDQTALGIAHFHTRDDALRAVTAILDTGPSAVELFDGVAIERARQTPGFRDRLSFIDGEPGSLLIVEYFGASKAELRDDLDELERVMNASSRGYQVVRLFDPDAIQNAWTVRKEGLGLLMGVKSEYKPWPVIEDASVPVEHLADYIQDLSMLIEGTDTKAVYYAHASAGCLHVRPFLNTKEAAEVEKMHAIAEGSMKLVKKYGGVVSSEHGDGLVRARMSERLLGEALYDVYRQTKSIFDPKHLLNPGKVVDAPPMDENLRMGPDYQTRPIATEMDFSNDGGFAEAIELCNGNGACRKLKGGTMCPSFMVTREEEDSTRGRANALRAALSGQLPDEEWTGDRMYEVMDLCIQCKACKTECPSNVDMGKIKTEWLHHYWEDNGIPLRTRLFARQPQLARLIGGTPLAHMVNWVNRQTPIRALMEATVGISRERELPPFAARSFAQWYGKQTWPDEGPPVVLFADTFNNFHTPEVAQAAAAFLRATGHTVHLPQQTVCCGRTLLSKGFVNDAQLQALETVEALYPYAEEGIPIVGLEPSCILTLRDEFLSLLPGEPRAEALAEQAMTFEEFVAQRAEEGAFDAVAWNGAPRRTLLHGHCHQKALVGTTAAERALALPGTHVDTVDSGCCGMAGAFGYEAEHLDISHKMAERVLAPAVRETPDATCIAAPGFSCRSQIKDITGRTALHPAQVLQQALQDPQDAGQAASDKQAVPVGHGEPD